MRNRLIPSSEWFPFFDQFSRRHQGSLATVYVLSPRIGSQIEARNMPLEGIVSSADAKDPISIHLGSAPPRSNIEHVIQQPKQVWVELSESGLEEALEIESQDGTKTLIQFRPQTRSRRARREEEEKV